MEVNLNEQQLNDKHGINNDCHFLLKKMFAIVYKIYLLISNRIQHWKHNKLQRIRMRNLTLSSRASSSIAPVSIKTN